MDGNLSRRSGIHAGHSYYLNEIIATKWYRDGLLAGPLGTECMVVLPYPSGNPMPVIIGIEC